MSGHRSELAAYSDKGDASGVARCKRALEFNYSRIRKHCTRNDLELPHDVPDEGAGVETVIDDEICRLLNDRDFGVFEARDRDFGDTLFLSRDRRRPRVLVTSEAKAEHPDQIDAAVKEALRLLTYWGGGDVVIRLDRNNLGRIVAVQENIPPATNH